LNSQELFGERDFFDSLRRSAAAVANEDCLLLSMPKSKLEDIFISKKHIAVQFYWHFWKTLANSGVLCLADSSRGLFGGHGGPPHTHYCLNAETAS
jgi:CRP-like cAMP-binding protein